MGRAEKFGMNEQARAAARGCIFDDYAGKKDTTENKGKDKEQMRKKRASEMNQIKTEQKTQKRTCIEKEKKTSKSKTTHCFPEKIPTGGWVVCVCVGDSSRPQCPSESKSCIRNA